MARILAELGEGDPHTLGGEPMAAVDEREVRARAQERMIDRHGRDDETEPDGDARDDAVSQRHLTVAQMPHHACQHEHVFEPMARTGNRHIVVDACKN